MQQMHSPLSVRGFTKWSEADSDDEDKLHIVEEDSIHDSSEEKPTVFDLSSAKQLQKRDTLDDCSTGSDTLIQEIRVKEECITDEEEEKDQINDTQAGVIRPDIPEMEQSVPKGEVRDEYGTSDEFSQLYSCPYCSRGYKRHTALKEHIKLRHEKNKDDLCCSLCSDTFTYRTQLDRHMNAHKNGKAQRIGSHLGVNRKFKCTECSKAFKYKHHLKEHLRIHSGEKPYECSNCKKRFSHSGSYSSHISSKKCVAIPPADNRPSQDAGSKTAVESDKKHLGERLHLKKIKEEPNEHEHEPEPVKTTTPVVTTTTVTTPNNEGGISVQSAARQGVVQALVLPTVSLVQPININLRDLQNMLKLSVDGNIMLQAVGSSNVNGGSSKVVYQQPQTQAMQSPCPHLQVISAISLPVLDQDGNSKIIINCSVDSQVSNSDQNTAPSILTYQTAAPEKVADTNRAPAELGEFKSLAEPNTTQLNVTPTPKLPTSRPVPTQISIIKSTQSAALNKTASIIKVTKLIPGQTKFSQPAMLLLRTVNRPQGLVVKQLSVANPHVTVGTTGLKTNPENTVIAEEQNPLAELDQVAEVTSTSRDKHQPEDLSTSLVQEVHLKTETMSKIKEDGKEALEIQKDEVTPRSESTMAHKSVVCGDGFHNYATCLFCDNSPSSTDALKCQEQESHRSLPSLLGDEESSQQPPVRSLLPLLEAYSKDSRPSEEQLSQVATSVNLPRDVVSRWFQKMQLKNILLNYPGNPEKGQQTAANFQPKPSMATQTPTLNPSNELHSEVSLGQKSDPSTPNHLPNDVDVNEEDMKEKWQVEPLDLSLPKSSCLNGTTSVTEAALNPSVPTQDEPLNLTSFRKETLNGNTIFVTQSTNPINIIATPLPTLVAIEEPGGIPCLKAAISTKQHTIFIPQLSYTYTSPTTDTEANTTTFSKIKTSPNTTSTATDIQELDSCEKMTDAGDEWKGLDDSSLSPIKKRRKLYGGQYACDLCDKCFQKSSSLLRHKYEHTGKRPHECGICKKAFKHKHHLIEHSRLHSGEKPYRCDKCGKRFSHSGSYSQHMNHRYSYCKKVYDQPEPNNSSSTPPLLLDSDERESDDEEEIDDYKEPEGEKDGEEDFLDFDMSDIRVVRIGQEYEETEEELGRGEKEKVKEEDVVDSETLKTDVVKTLGVEEQTMKHKTEEHIVKPTENKALDDSKES